MSRGIGAMQRRILETLEEARQAAPNYPGSEYTQCGPAWAHGATYGVETPLAAGWIWVGKSCVKLAPEVYDLRCSARYVAQQTQSLLSGDTLPDAFSAAFSRAVRGLVARRYLMPLELVPLEGYDPTYMRERDLEWLADGVYFRWDSRQIRFVKR